MKLLFIGGTRFVGLHLVDAALAAGHEVTLFHRGVTEAARRPGVTHLLGDRRQGLDALRTGQWDAVIDTCGFLPSEVRASAELLRGRVGRYVFISSISAYASFAQVNHEASALAELPQGEDTVNPAEAYGPLKAQCERAAVQCLGEDRVLLIRPGLIVGPGDPTGRFTWWPARIARATEAEPVLVPGSPDRTVQFIDARDLAAFVLQSVLAQRAGPCNVVAPPCRWTFGELMATCALVAGSAPRWVWAEAAWLEAHGVGPWMDMPLWLPDDGEHACFMRVDTSRAQAAGLQVRPLADTVRDTLSWWRGLPPDKQAFAATGLKPEREQALLRLLDAAATAPA